MLRQVATKATESSYGYGSGGMEKRKFLKLMIGASALAATGLTAGCVPVDPYRPYPGTRYDYYYYPDVNVYYGINSGYYYYFTRRRWIRSRKLPRHIILLPRYRRPIFVGRRAPYRLNREHRRRYPPVRRRPANVRPNVTRPAQRTRRAPLTRRQRIERRGRIRRQDLFERNRNSRYQRRRGGG